VSTTFCYCQPATGTATTNKKPRIASSRFAMCHSHVQLLCSRLPARVQLFSLTHVLQPFAPHSFPISQNKNQAGDANFMGGKDGNGSRPTGTITVSNGVVSFDGPVTRYRVDGKVFAQLHSAYMSWPLLASVDSFRWVSTHHTWWVWVGVGGYLSILRLFFVVRAFWH